MQQKAAPLIAEEALPEGLRELARVLGQADAMRLVAAMGGRRVTVPVAVVAGHPLSLALSAEGFERLVENWRGEALELPKGDAWLRELRHEAVRQCRARHMKLDDIASETGYTRRHVINILMGRTDGADRFTIDMFGDEAEREMAEAPNVSHHQAVVSTAGSANDPFGLNRKKGGFTRA